MFVGFFYFEKEATFCLHTWARGGFTQLSKDVENETGSVFKEDYFR
jgi:hypothetical protein